MLKGVWIGLVVRAWLASIVLAGPAIVSAAADVEPLVGRDAFTRALNDLEIRDEERIVTDVVYGDYTQSLEAESDRRAERRAAAGQDRLEAALAGRIVIDADELRGLRLAVHDTEQASWPIWERLASDLVENILSLAQTDTDRVQRARLDLRRRMWLEPRRRHENASSYAGEGVDIVELVGAATGQDSAMTGVEPDRIADALVIYVNVMDELLQASASQERADRWAVDRARLIRDSTAAATAERDLVGRWIASYEVNSAAVDRIGRLLSDPQHVVRWRESFHRACFPSIYTQTNVHHAVRWIRRHLTDPDGLSRLAAIERSYDQELAALRETATGLMVQSRVRHGARLTLETRPDAISDDAVRELHLELLRNSGRQTALDRDADARLSALLDEPMRRRMTAELAGRAP